MAKFGKSAEKNLSRILKGATHVIFTETVWRPDDAGGKIWYFTLLVGRDKGEHRLHAVNLQGSTHEAREELRGAITGAIIAHCLGRPVVIIDCLSELDAARLCEQQWPSAKATRIREGIEAEFAERADT